MNRVYIITFRLLLSSLVLCCCLSMRTLAQTAAPSPSPESAKPPETKPANPGGGNPFGLESAPPLPAGMTGSDASDPRFKLTPGMYDAGETSRGLKHVLLLKKPDAFELGASDPNDPKVNKTLTTVLGVADPSKMPGGMKLVFAGLAFANSDLAFQGNFYGVSIYDISNPAKTRLLTSMVCPGGQGDVSVYKNLMFMSVEMPNGRLDCGTAGFPTNPPPPPGEENKPHVPAAQKERFRGVRSFDIHDITVYSRIGLAAGACSGNGILLDIKDPVHPKRVDAVNDPNYAYWHSASFSNDGKKVVFTDEWGGGLGARCRANDPNKWGADAIFTLNNNKLSFASYYKMPAAQGDSENCVAHNGSLIPVPGRDLEVQAWYQGGISVMDFTDAEHPVEIGYFDRGPIDPKMLVLGGDWSAYWYNGHIYASEIARGLDIFELTPTNFLTQNEIDAAKTVRMSEFNVQNQQKIVWPRNLIVAKAYVDQLERSQALPSDQITTLRQAIQTAESSKMNKSSLAKLKTLGMSLDKSAATAKSPRDVTRLQALAEILKRPAKQ